MPKGPRIANDDLLRAGLDLMRQNGKPLTRMPSKGREMLFKLPNGETVRARTSNDHILISLAEAPEIEAPMNTEGTDFLLVIMPEQERVHGKVIAYLLETQMVTTEARRTHSLWRENTGRPDSTNQTRNLWFDDKEEKVAHGYAKKWAKHRLEGSVATLNHTVEETAGSNQNGNLKAAIESAQNQIATLAGVSPQAVKISIEFAM